MKLINIDKSFGGRKIIDNFSLEIKKGDVICLTGASGIGKTTLLNIIMGFVKPDSGEIIDIPEKISCVFQEDRLIYGLSAMDNIRFVTGNNICEEEIISYFNMLNLTKKQAYQKAEKLSGGEKRRVALLRALLYPSELLLLDEAFKGLDDYNKKAAIDLTLKKAHTIIAVTHEKDEIAMLSGRELSLESQVY